MDPQYLLAQFKTKEIDFYAGVPDSLLKDFCAYLEAEYSPEKYHITANEGSAVSLALGYHLATGRRGCVYLQNSGLAHILNPLVSMADRKVYGIPLVLLIGWRGEILPNGEQIKDEPQHRKQGEVSIKQLESSGILCQILSPEDKEEESFQQIEKLLNQGEEEKRSVAFIVRKGFFSAYSSASKENLLGMEREEALETVLKSIDSLPVVSTTGMISRELFECRERLHQSHQTDFLSVGGMGHASMIAAGIAQQQQGNIYCLDGDGAALMHLGNMAWLGQSGLKNFKHILFNNGAHDSVGGQATVGQDIRLPAIAKNCGYRWVASVSEINALKDILEEVKKESGPLFLEIMVRRGHRPTLGRPTQTSQTIKQNFMEKIRLT